MLVRTAAGHAAAVPLAARIHEGVVWSNRDQRTLLDKLVLLFMPLAAAMATGRVPGSLRARAQSRARLHHVLSTDATMNPLDVITLYAYRNKIELGFRRALHVVGSYAYHFWMSAMTPLRRGTGNQYMHHKSENCLRQVRTRLDAYHRHVQLGCIAQGVIDRIRGHFETPASCPTPRIHV